MPYTLPTTPSAVSGTAWLQALDDAVEAVAGMFYGSSAPAHKNGRLWLDTTSGYVVKVSIGGAWYAILDAANTAGGGLVRKIAGAFTTLAPTSAVAASGATDLVRKNEVDSIVHQYLVPLGTVDASATFELGDTPQASTAIADVRFFTATAQALSGADYRVLQIYDETGAVSLQSGTLGPPPTGVLLASSNYTGGNAFAANTWRACGVDQNNTGLAAGRRLSLRVTKVGAPAALAGCLAVVRYKVTV